MTRIDGGCGSNFNVGRIQAREPVVGTKGCRRVKLAGRRGMPYCASAPSSPSRGPGRSLSSYRCIQELMRDLPSARARGSRPLPQHIPLSERKEMLQAHRHRKL